MLNAISKYLVITIVAAIILTSFEELYLIEFLKLGSFSVIGWLKVLDVHAEVTAKVHGSQCCSASSSEVYETH